MMRKLCVYMQLDAEMLMHVLSMETQKMKVNT
jgi:hypothetical protein